jgi:hypothetical protein
MTNLTKPVAYGVVLGTALGAWILVNTALAPLAEDTGFAVAAMFGLVFLALAVPGFAVRRRGGHLVDALEAGATAGAITFALFLLFGILRVNLFLDTIRSRSDWQNLVADYARSDFQSLRAYANFVYAKGIILFPIAGVAAGAISGSVGGVLAGFIRPSS